MNFLRSLDLSKRFIILTAALIILTVFSAQWFYSRQSRTYLELRLKEKAAFINKFYAYVVAGMLMRKDDIGLLQVINTLEEDSEISSVIVVDQRNQVRYHLDSQKVGTVPNDPLIKNVLQSGEYIETPSRDEGGRALALVSPLKVPGGGQLLGAMRIDLTYHTIDRQMEASGKRFWFIILGSVVSCAGLMLNFLGKWVLIPLQRLRSALVSVNPVQPDTQLPEGSDEIGEVNAAVNALMHKFRREVQQMSGQQKDRQKQEKAWINQLVRLFLPSARVIVADKDNFIISDSGNGVAPGGTPRHLLDLIKDSNFATLVNSAFQREGDIVKGPVSLENKSYMASVLSVPPNQSIAVKTLITLLPN